MTKVSTMPPNVVNLVEYRKRKYITKKRASDMEPYPYRGIIPPEHLYRLPPDINERLNEIWKGLFNNDK